MLISPKTLGKVQTLEQVYGEWIFAAAGTVPMEYLVTREHFRSPPDARAGDWLPASPGTPWGGAWMTAWFRGQAVMPAGVEGQAVYVRANTDACETFCFVEGMPRGIFNHLKDAANLGKHHALLLTPRARAGETFGLAFESYAGHPVVGTQPYEQRAIRLEHRFDSVELLIRRDDVMAFVLDLRALNQLVAVLPTSSFRLARIAAVLEDVLGVVVQRPDEQPEPAWRPALARARELMVPVLAARNADSAPRAGLVGHSHMDTAWLWPVDETIRKCARTYANVLTLMEQYPEYTFVQSSPYHAELMRRHYPAIFEGIRRRVAEGRWEPTGGMWVEPDCNITGGESLIRQFLKGQGFTRRHFGFTADVFWLPDTFGYSAAIPQIMTGCGLNYFLTTKLTWNETNTFPYDTFRWRGIDGTTVLAHFNDTHCAPDPATLVNRIVGGGKDFRTVENFIQHKDVNDRRLISYGFGDGGGGPDYEMLEMARRCRDLDGCPRAEHTSVSRFMRELDATSRRIPEHVGELYVEGHRGTLTSLAAIKRLNRQAELALRDAEILTVLGGRSNDPGVRKELEQLWDTLLINHFHDILPGTSIPEVNDRAIAELGGVVTGAGQLRDRMADGLLQADVGTMTLFNTLNWARTGTLALAGVPAGKAPAGTGVVAQKIEPLTGGIRWLVKGASVPGLGASALALAAEPPTGPSVFDYSGPTLESPLLRVGFDEAGAITSLLDKRIGRELRGRGAPLNTFWLGEDVPQHWDNWDVDEDLWLKFKPQTGLMERTVVADGPLQFRLRSQYRIGHASRLTQDMVFHADSPRIDFETRVEWHDRHHFLKAGFELALSVDEARHEIQFGHVRRATHGNTTYDRARFEVSNHKWTDLSENRFGVAILNDCKYGISVRGADARLSLMKGGCHPDPRGDEGVHDMTYSLLPHEGGFAAETVVRPAYELNVPVVARPGRLACTLAPLLSVDAPNVICEAIKPAEDGSGFVARLYEVERSGVSARVTWGRPGWTVREVNMLEEPLGDGNAAPGALAFRAFEIKTLKLVPT